MAEELDTIGKEAATLLQGDNRRKVYVKTYGCQMNVYDSDRMADALAADGYARVETPEDADLYLINTCHIREKAAEKVYSELGRLQKLKDERRTQGRDLTVGVTGCVAQAEGREIFRRAPVVDLVVGPQTYHRLPDAVAKARSGTRVLETDYALEDKFAHLPALRRRSSARAASAPS
jgi:tRNA-2-methylthio-N6-dimethylallyladenosine synthase